MKTFFTLIMLLYALGFNATLQAQCTAPSNHSVAFGNNQSTFLWDQVPNALSYNLQIKFSYSSEWLNLEENMTSNTISFTGLMQSATLNWRVMSKCSSTDSIYGASQTYVVPCEKPNSLTATNITGTTATFNWIPAPVNPGQTPAFKVSYRIAGSTGAWTTVATNTTANSINVTGLNSNTTYDFCVNKLCSYFMSDPAFGQFTTQYVSCDVPTNLSMGTVTNNSAILNWNHVNGYTNYYVQYKKASQTNWTTVYVANNQHTLNNLSQETLYDWRVMANCSNATQSVYSSTKKFTTYSNTCMSYGSNNNSEWIDLFNLGTISRTSGAEIGGYVRSSLTTNLAKGSSYTATISCGYQPGISMGDYYAIYIDYNKNGTFTDANELVVAPGTLISSASANYTSSFTIPNNISLGNTKMRVILRRSTSTNAPCEVGFQGETEDYTVKIVASSNAPAMNDEETITLTRSSINDYDLKSSFNISPNPSTSSFVIDIDPRFGAIDYEISSIDGRIIQKNTVETMRFEVDLSAQSSGLYLMKLRDRAGNIKVQKMILNR